MKDDIKKLEEIIAQLEKDTKCNLLTTLTSKTGRINFAKVR